ncbi:hypothetical protein BO94DRAFT_283347 [Aspergillus sclerotioniger CBS 115572]|uniref:Uncharacterized protein n=1 Tax=Aspergillus sclerotioniger CBS 115572 TaxID=1450535 RepID=A0A317X893_9EURO|nr:hypothetical protein BO94DRAFT_283347 [Aspergillus sclerotioniger CBS 115572]PWY94749.1 hypothetical protein BO94DRAFT_283347 [Aspergillus sclerotioniger CBS 115572]
MGSDLERGGGGTSFMGDDVGVHTVTDSPTILTQKTQPSGNQQRPLSFRHTQQYSLPVRPTRNLLPYEKPHLAASICSFRGPGHTRSLLLRPTPDVPSHNPFPIISASPSLSSLWLPHPPFPFHFLFLFLFLLLIFFLFSLPPCIPAHASFSCFVRACRGDWPENFRTTIQSSACCVKEFSRIFFMVLNPLG